MFVGFVGFILFLIYLAVVIFTLHLLWRFVASHERLSSAQERSASALQEIAGKMGGRTGE